MRRAYNQEDATSERKYLKTYHGKMFINKAQILFNRVNENALLMELKARGIKAAAQYPIKVRYKD